MTLGIEGNEPLTLDPPRLFRCLRSDSRKAGTALPSWKGQRVPLDTHTPEGDGRFRAFSTYCKFSTDRINQRTQWK